MIGTVDFFQDMAEQLDKLGVCYTLAVGDAGQFKTSVWSNCEDFEGGASHMKHALDQFLASKGAE